jgi:hypothetical protein
MLCTVCGYSSRSDRRQSERDRRLRRRCGAVGRPCLDAFQDSRWGFAFGRLMFVERDLHRPGHPRWPRNGPSVSACEREADRHTRWVRERSVYCHGDWPRDLIDHLEARRQTDQSHRIRRGTRYAARFRVSPGRHTLTVKVKFQAYSQTQVRTFRRIVVGCPATH